MTMSEKIQDTGFGTFKGIFVPNVTMMFGVILFLRLGVVVGNVGLLEFSLIIALSLCVMIATSLSIAMVVTNMQVGSGGAYFLISRSLGIEIGGAIGLALVVSQLVSLSLCITGFAYSLTSIYPHLNLFLIEVVSLVVLSFFSIYSANLALKIQTVIFFTLIITVGSIFLGIKPGYSGSLEPYYQPPLGFWAAFAVFYPALTGIEAGMALSGTLKNASRSLSIGTITSVIFAATTYLCLAVFLWFVLDSRALAADPMILLKQSKFPLLIYIGLWSATLSSALGNLIGAPRMVQMIAEDTALPQFLSRTFGKYDEPRYATFLILCVAILLIFFTTIDQILPILTMICLLTYGTINLVAGLSELIHGPSWRPTFRCPWQISMAGAVLCYLMMFTIDPIWAIIAIGIVVGLYVYYSNKDLDVPFHDFRDSIMLYLSRKALYRLSDTEDHPMNWMPQILVVTKTPTNREQMIYLAQALAQRSGILTVVTILPELWVDPEQLESKHQLIKEWLSERSIECISEVISHENFYEGITLLMRSHGLGSLQPNTILMTISDAESDTFDGIHQILDSAQISARNILLYFEAEELPISDLSDKPDDKKTIDVWWNPDDRDDFELMMGFVLSLRTSPVWTDRTVNVQTIARSKKAKKHIEKYFRSFFKKIRVRFKIKIHVEPELSLVNCVHRYSEQADLIFFPLKTKSKFDDEKEFNSYLEEVITELPGDTPTFAVSCYDNTDHKEIYLQ
jgi:amino acid transporter